MGRQYFVFLFRRGTEQPHQDNMYNSTSPNIFLIHKKIHFEDTIRSEDPVQLLQLLLYTIIANQVNTSILINSALRSIILSTNIL
jgi:hypothetical protein